MSFRSCCTKGTSAVTNTVSFYCGVWAFSFFFISLVQFDTKWKVTGTASNREPLIAQTLGTACYKVRTGAARMAPNFWFHSHMPELPVSGKKLSQYMIDAHAGHNGGFPQGLIHNISLMITGLLPRQAGNEEKGEDIMVWPQGSLHSQRAA